MQKNQILLLITITAIYGVLFCSIGFLSDDYDLLYRAQSHSLFLPLENHHYSIFINGLFSMTSLGRLHPQIFHMIAIIFHAINIFLVMLFCSKFLKLSSQIAFFITLLFAINLPGVEALVWCCALPYVINTTLTLCSMMIYCSYLESKSMWSTTLLLSGIFLVGIVTWEWIVLVIPILLALGGGIDHRKTPLQKVVPLTPLFIILVLAFLVRNGAGLTTGYQINSPLQVFGILISSPFVGLFPFFPKEFYTSFIGVASETLLFALMVLAARKKTKLKLLFIIFFISQAPNSIMGHPQSRYFYFSTFPLYAFGVVVLSKAVRLRILCSFWVAACLLLSILRIHHWQKASVIAEGIKQELQSIVDIHNDPLVVLELPESYGPESMIWRPPLWRCGLETFNGNITNKQISGGDLPVYRFSWNYTDSFQIDEVKI